MAKKQNSNKNNGPIGEIARSAVLAHYAASGSFNATAREFGIHPMKVKRMWEGASPSERHKYANTADDSAAVVAEAIVEHNVEWDRAQRSKMREMFEISTNEMLIRLKESPGTIKNKDLLAIIKGSYSIAENKPLDGEAPSDKESGDNKISATHAFFEQFTQTNVTVINTSDDEQKPRN